MCPVATESKNSKPSSNKKINKKINTNLETVVGEESNINSQSLQTSSDSSESGIGINNELSDSGQTFGVYSPPTTNYLPNDFNGQYVAKPRISNSSSTSK